MEWKYLDGMVDGMIWNGRNRWNGWRERGWDDMEGNLEGMDDRNVDGMILDERKYKVYGMDDGKGHGLWWYEIRLDGRWEGLWWGEIRMNDGNSECKGGEGKIIKDRQGTRDNGMWYVGRRSRYCTRRLIWIKNSENMYHNNKSPKDTAITVIIRMQLKV